MKYLYLCFISFCFHCSFANLDRSLKPFSNVSVNGNFAKEVTILNHNRLYNHQTHKGYRDFGPGSYRTYLSGKQKEIGNTRYHWKDIYIYTINDKEFKFTDIKTDYVFFVSVDRPVSDWDGAEWKHLFQVFTLCVIPCKQNVNLDVSVKLYYKNNLVSEKVSHHSATRYLSPWYLPFPFLFQMRDYGNLFNEPSVYTTMYLYGFQEAIDEIYLELPKQTLESE